MTEAAESEEGAALLAKTVSPQVPCLSIPLPPPFPVPFRPLTAARRRFSACAEALQTRAEETTAAAQSRGTPTATATAPGEAVENADLLFPSPRRALRGPVAAGEEEEETLASSGRSRGTACVCFVFVFLSARQ